MPHGATSGITRITRDNWIHSLGTMNVYSRCHDPPSNRCQHIPLNSTSVGLFVLIEKKSEDRQIRKDSSSGDHEHLHYFIIIILLCIYIHNKVVLYVYIIYKLYVSV